MGFRSSILAGVNLVREAIQSPNFQSGAQGWAIRRDGSAEFADLAIRSSGGSDSTVTVANGAITIANGSNVTVVEIDSNGYRLYDANGSLVAQITLDSGGLLGGFYTRNFAFPENVYAFLSGGQLTSGPVDNAVAAIHGFLQYNVAPTATNPYSVQTLSTGLIDTGLDDEARIQLISERAQRPKVWVDGGSSAIKADLQVTGKVIADNIRVGTVQCPAPGATPAQTSATVTFADPMDSTPRIGLTPLSASTNLNTANIRWAVATGSNTGFTVNCWRDTNNATTFYYTAISD